MARPHKSRCIGHIPGVTVFKPSGISLTNLEQVTMHFDELEALRLSNLEDLDQEQTARRMGISRATVSRILKRARKKITLALVEGHAVFLKEGAAPATHRPPGKKKGKRMGPGSRPLRAGGHHSNVSKASGEENTIEK